MKSVLMEWKVVIAMLRVGFMVFLAVAAWQDFRKHHISVNVLVIFGIIGGSLRCMQVILEMEMLGQEMPGQGMPSQGMPEWSQIYGILGRHLWDLGLGAGVGGVLLALSYAAREAIGKGDGWFFVVSGMYLGVSRNLFLLAGGLGLCFLAGLALIVRGIIQGRSVRQLSLPFLPYLIPAGIGVMLL